MNLKDLNVKDVLKEHGYKYTWQRDTVYKVFCDHIDEHLTTEEVYKYISDKNPEIGIATVYRTLQLFHKLGILDQITFEDNIVRYELKLKNKGHRHHHLICLNCGKITEVNVDKLDAIEEEIKNKYKFEIVDHSLKVMGYCEDCQKKLGDVDEK
ncbi:Fur family transcriptional regulator [Peptoniphilus raoultii]|uniref:Fur family transcriptional regulator n=1 Tax=Peptoniphilus raoultii TaxID=1776387 RepID=UPI0008DB0A85|nr:Fur family transcriptional regulator [Peptoniphilus raoultii]